MSARIVVTLILEYGGNDVAEYDAVMETARVYATDSGDELAGDYDAVRVVDVQVTG